MTSDDTTLQIKGEGVVKQLFQTAHDRLAQRGITLEFDSTAIKWLLNETEWKSSVNPIRTLDGNWHNQVSATIEDLILNNEVQQGDTLFVRMDEDHVPPQLAFSIESQGQ